MEHRDPAMDGGDVSDAISLDSEDVGVETRCEPALAVAEIARGGSVVGRSGQRLRATHDLSRIGDGIRQDAMRPVRGDPRVRADDEPYADLDRRAHQLA